MFLLSVVILLRFFLSHFSFFLTRLCLCTLTVDGAVSAKIADELAYKKEAATEGEPDFLKEFENSGIWTVCPTSLFVLGVKVGY